MKTESAGAQYFRHTGDNPDVSHDPVIMIDASWTPDFEGGWRVRNDEWMVDAYVCDGHSTMWTCVVLCPTGEPTVNCGGVMRRFVNLVSRAYFEEWFEPVADPRISELLAKANAQLDKMEWQT